MIKSKAVVNILKNENLITCYTAIEHFYTTALNASQKIAKPKYKEIITLRAE